MPDLGHYLTEHWFLSAASASLFVWLVFAQPHDKPLQNNLGTAFLLWMLFLLPLFWVVHRSEGVEEEERNIRARCNRAHDIYFSERMPKYAIIDPEISHEFKFRCFMNMKEKLRSEKYDEKK